MMKRLILLLSGIFLLSVCFPLAAPGAGAYGKKGKKKKAANQVLLNIRIPQAGSTLDPGALRNAMAQHLVLRNMKNVSVAAKTSTETLESLRLAVQDLMQYFPGRYPRGPEFLARIAALLPRAQRRDPALAPELDALRQEALLANPLLDFDRLLVLKRARGQLGLPTNHQCNACLPRQGYDNEITVLSPVRPGGALRTLYRPPDARSVGEIDLDFDAGRLLFTMSHENSWQIHEIGVDGEGLRQVSREDSGVDNFDPCYLPDGRIVFASTAAFTGVPCWHGKERACTIYEMNADGSGMRQLCFDQDLDLHPSVLDNGQLIFSRWDYTGIMHAYVRPLMVMNPDGSNQRSIYGSNDYYPNCLFYPRAIPGHPTQVTAIMTGYHGWNRSGQMIVLDTAKGWREASGILHRIGHRGEPIVPIIRDNLMGNTFPQFLQPWPLSDKYFLVAMLPDPNSPWGIYLVDIYDNMVPILTDPQHDFFEPVPLRPRPRPPVIPDRVDLARTDATVYLSDIYAGPGLAGVPRGAVKRLRVLAYNWGYPGLAGPDMIGYSGPWDAMRILGTVPVYEDGSSAFRVPACTPLAVQPLDAEGKALALMRSWYTAMPGENATCIGCHEQPGETPAARTALAARRGPVAIEPWHGPARGFDFEREVQPVLDKFCVGCHDGAPYDGRPRPDLRARRFAAHYEGLPMSQLHSSRLAPEFRDRFDLFPPYVSDHVLIGNRKMLYTPAYDVLARYIRRVNIEDHVGLLNPGEYSADTSELIQMLKKGHHGVMLDAEAWDRLYTWIDLNGPCHGTWRDIAPIPNAADRRRHELALKYGGPKEDPEQIFDLKAVGTASSASPSSPAQGTALAVPLTKSSASPSSPAQGTALAVRLTKPGVESGIPASTPGHDPQSQKNRFIGSTTTLNAQSTSGIYPKITGWPFTVTEARQRQASSGPWRKTLDLGQGVTLTLIRIPAGTFIMGASPDDPNADTDEFPPAPVTLTRDFWIGECEITNAQFRRFFPDHFSGYFMKRSQTMDGPGITMNDPDQPAVRLSWQEAQAYCQKLSQATGLRFTLPTEAQWEYACRAGDPRPLNYGSITANFTRFANLADASLSRIYAGSAGVVVLQDFPSVTEVDDQGLATAPVASYRPNAWGLFDMHGNAAEWTLSSWRPYPYRDGDGRNGSDPASPKVVRGGSFHDRPQRARASFRLNYPAWQRVHNVGFRVVTE